MPEILTCISITITNAAPESKTARVHFLTLVKEPRSEGVSGTARPLIQVGIPTSMVFNEKEEIKEETLTLTRKKAKEK